MKMAPREHAQMEQKTAKFLQLQFINKVGDDRVKVEEASSTVQEEMRKNQNPSPEFTRRSRVHSHSLHKKRCDQKSNAGSWKRPSGSKVLSVRMLLSGLSTKQPEIKKAMEMQAEAEHRRSDGTPQNEINMARKATRLRQC